MNTQITSNLPMVTAARGEMCYCPGCSHAAVLDSIGTALGRAGLRPEEVCIVSDIGCIGTADRYFACHTFHGLHGRSMTYAEGIKRIRPDMTVLVLIGDGGCGIGTAHLVHAARRGIGIKIIVCNNFNFGMTGGQHSPTTPIEGHTTTTPDGALDRPFDICQTVLVNGAAHVGRFSALDPDLSLRIEAAIKSPGFALLDIWELCTAYYVPANKLKPTSFATLSEKHGLPLRLFRDESRQPSASATPLPNVEEKRPRESTVPSALHWSGRREICVAGSAGQRIRSAAGVIGEAAVAGGLFAAQLDDFPITVRKGHSISQLIIADKPIRYHGVDRPGLFILLSEEGVTRLGGLPLLDPDTLVIADLGVALPPVVARVIRIDLHLVEKQVGKASAALTALALGILHAQWLDAGALERSIEQLAGRYAESNLAAVRLAIRLFEDAAGRSPIPTATQEAES